MSPERLDKLEALATAATPGPWEPKVVSGDAACYHNPGSRLRLNTNQSWAVGPLPHRCGLQAQHDAAFIAAARTAVPELIARVRELEYERGQFMGFIHPCEHEHVLARAEVAEQAAADLERQLDHERTLRRQAEEEVAQLQALIAEHEMVGRADKWRCLHCGAHSRIAHFPACPWGQAAAAHRARVEGGP